MKKYSKLIVVLAISIISLLFAVSVNAAPINGLEQTLIQPNGKEITVYLFGDEIYSYMTDGEGNVIVENPETGYYVYASLSDEEITATNYALGIEGSGSTGGGAVSFLTAEDIPQSEFTSAYENSRFYVDPNEPEVMSLDYADKDFNGMNINNIVVFIRFSNATYSQTSKSFYDSMFNTAATSLKSYYDETTYGKLGITSTFYPTTTSSTILTYQDINSSSYYNAADYNYDWQEQCNREQAMFKRALEYVKDQISADLDLDKNNDGYVDMITFILPGRIVPGSNQVCWPHQWSFDSDYVTTINGLETNLYNVQIEGALRGLKASDGTYTFQTASAIIAHETYHILGFPDMYYYNYAWPTNDDSLGKWDLMCAADGAHTPAYMKWQYGGWIDIPEIKENGTYTLNSLQNGGTCAYKLRSPNSANEYFIVEYRNKTGDFETNIPNTGLIVYRVLASNHTCGNCYATASDGTDDELRYLAQRTSGSYSPTLSTGESSGISISSISATGTTASFTVSFTDKKYLNYFKDENLANAVISAIGKDKSEITIADLQSLTSLSVFGGTNKQNYDLTGIEQLTGLRTLSLKNCYIDDISALQGLTNLTSLTLTDNHITDISALSNLIKLKTLYLRGNYIDDYSPVSSYYNNLTDKDFSLTDKNDAVFYVPDLSNGVLGTAYLRLTDTRGTYLYYSFEKYDSATDELLSRKRGTIYVSKSTTSKSVMVPESISDETDTYVKLKVYENDTYRHLMSETIIDSSALNLSILN